MQNEISRLLKSNEEKQKEVKNLNDKLYKKQQIHEKQKESSPKLFKYDGNNKFSGIIKYLSDICGGNVADKGIVIVEVSSTYWFYYQKNVFKEGTSSFWVSEDEPNSWFKIDFIDKMILLEAYSINACSLRSFKLDCSNDGANWVQIDTRNDVQTLKDDYKSETFTVSTTTAFRFFRFTMTDKRWDNNYSFTMYQIEFFGYLV